MRSRGSDRILLGVLVGLAAISLAMKAAAGAPAYVSWQRGPEVQQRLLASLRAQGFATAVRPLKLQSPIVYARRGDCRLSIRDAAAGSDVETAFLDDARAIGPIRYLYKGRSYDAPPALRMRLGNVEASLLHATGGRVQLHVPLALATSTQCGDADFGLSDMRLPD